MSLLPLIQRPCPYLDRLESVMEGDFCKMCRREVHDLTGMDEAGRADFLAACGGDACVRYTFNAKPALAAALIAASVAVVAVPVAAAPRGHHPSRAQHPPRQVPVQMVPMVTAGVPVMPEPPIIPAQPRPPEPPARPESPPPNPK